MSEDSLSGCDIEYAGFMVHAQSAAENDRVLVEFGRLARFLPGFGTAHVGNANCGGLRIDAAYVFFDDLRFGPGGFDAGRMRYQSGHGGDAS